MAALKEDLHKLIDTAQDQELLEDIFMILSSRLRYTEGNLWESLTDEQKKEALASESEMDDKAFWVSHEEMKSRNSQWLT